MNTQNLEASISLCDPMNPGFGYQIRITRTAAPGAPMDVLFTSRNPATGEDLVRVCTCCRTERTALHAHGKPCEIHGLAPVVLSPIPLHMPGGEDCTGPTVRAAVLAAYRARGGAALEIALKIYGESA